TLDRAAGEVRLRVSTFAGYAALGDAFAARALPAAEPSDAIRALADRLTVGLSSRHAQAARLYAYVAARIRYVGIQYGTGRVVPDDAAAIARRGYGDCKDHVAPLQALLAAKGIFSEPALIGTKARYALAQPPTLAPLDHVLIFIPEFDAYLDPTSPYAAFGVLPFEDYDKPVVLAGAGGARLDRTPPLLPGAATAETRTEARITADGSVIGRTVTTARGPAAVTLREVAAGIEEDGGDSTAADDLRRLGTPGRGDFDFASPRDPDGAASGYAVGAQFRLRRDTADTAGGRFAVPAGLPVLLRGGAFLISAKPVRGGRHLCYAGRETEAIHLLLPPGAAIGHLPHDVLAAAGIARYRAHYAAAAGAIAIERHFVLAAMHQLCTHAEYDAIRPVLRAMQRDLDARMSLRPVPAIAEAAPVAPAATGRCVGGNAACRLAAGDVVGGPQALP
ncbi:MAG: transglutaminase domain-containing protein, partial [Acetobacteraceae bacterium]